MSWKEGGGGVKILNKMRYLFTTEPRENTQLGKTWGKINVIVR